MLKVLAAVLAVLSAAISITIYTATLPDVQKQVADNAAAIEQNAEDISSVDNSIGGLNTRVGTLEEQKLYYHPISIARSSADIKYFISFLIINEISIPYTQQTIIQELSNYDRIVPLNGGFISTAETVGETVALSYATIVDNLHPIRGVYCDGSKLYYDNSVTLEDLITNASEFYDNVNQLL